MINIEQACNVLSACASFERPATIMRVADQLGVTHGAARLAVNAWAHVWRWDGGDADAYLRWSCAEAEALLRCGFRPGGRNG